MNRPTLILGLISAFLSCAISWELGDSKPNVVFILADDLGEFWSGLAPHFVSLLFTSVNASYTS